MSETSRRNFLVAAGVGTAAGGAVLVSAGAANARPADGPGSLADEPLLAVVDDHGGSTVRLLVGEREVVVEDRALVTSLLRAAGGR